MLWSLLLPQLSYIADVSKWRMSTHMPESICVHAHLHADIPPTHPLPLQTHLLTFQPSQPTSAPSWYSTELPKLPSYHPFSSQSLKAAGARKSPLTSGSQGSPAHRHALVAPPLRGCAQHGRNHLARPCASRPRAHRAPAPCAHITAARQPAFTADTAGVVHV